MPEFLTTPPVGRHRYPPAGGSMRRAYCPPAGDLRGLSRHALGAMVRPRALGALIMVAVLALVGAGVRPMPATAQAQGGAQPAAGQQTAGATPRPELAVGLQDLPPGYEEGPSLELMLNDVPLRDRVIRQTQPGAGPGWIWAMTYRSPTPVTQERVTFLAEDLAIFFVRALSDVAQISDWKEHDTAGLGSLATLYTFSYRVTGSDLVGDGALALFGPGDYLSYLAVLNVDGQAVSDLRMLARVVSSRVDSQRLTSLGQQ
jgi:hypothetical protein